MTQKPNETHISAVTDILDILKRPTKEQIINENQKEFYYDCYEWWIELFKAQQSWWKLLLARLYTKKMATRQLLRWVEPHKGHDIFKKYEIVSATITDHGNDNDVIPVWRVCLMGCRDQRFIVRK